MGYGGTKEEMQRLLADAQALTGVKYDINNLGDVYDAIHVIQGELGLTGVAAEEAKTTLVGSGNAVKASWENVLAALMTGQGLEESMENLTGSVVNFASNVAGMLSTVAPQIPVFFSTILEAIIANTPSLGRGVSEIVMTLVTGFTAALPDLISFVPLFFVELLKAFGALDMASIAGSIIEGIAKGLWASVQILVDALLGVFGYSLDELKAWLGINSPSRRAAREVGHWIPPGVGVGAEDNMHALDSPMGRVASHGLAVMRRAVMPGVSIPGTFYEPNASTNDEPQPVEVTVVLQGDAKGLFKVVNTYNKVRTKATNYNALAARR